jgi:hypothetical protein
LFARPVAIDQLPAAIAVAARFVRDEAPVLEDTRATVAA